MSTKNEEQAEELTKSDKLLEQVHKQINAVAQELEKSRISEYTELLLKPWRLIYLNLLAGTARGVGIAIGFTIFATVIVWVLKWLGALNLPIIGDYIADLVQVVQNQLEGRKF